MAATEAYCVKCRKTVEIKDAQETTMKNGRPATKGVCPTCGTGVFRIGGGSAAKAEASAAGSSNAAGSSAAPAAGAGKSKGKSKAGSTSS